MKRITIYTILSFLLAVGLGFASSTPTDKRTLELGPHLILFKELSNQTVMQSRIIFTSMPDVSNPAVCILAAKVVMIDPVYWDTYSFYERENLVLHELGHCELGYAHSGGIMYRSILPVDFYVLHRDELLTEYRRGLPKIGGGI